MGVPDHIVLSSNHDYKYCGFWDRIRFTYHKMFPSAKIHLAFVGDGWIGTNIYPFKPVKGVPTYAQAKMARFILASQLEGVVYIDDIDLFPLSKSFITDKLEKRPKGHLLCVGGEVYNNNGCYPVSQMTAEGSVWKQLINPKGLSYEDLIKEWVETPIMFDRREDMCIKLDWSKDDYFSDERLLRRLGVLNPVPKFELERGYTDYLDATIDRHTYNPDTDIWDYDIEKLKAGGYVNAHGVRPYKEELYKPLIDYINENY